ncbi:MAG: hypothetical protein Q4B84_01695, partial [Clostridia bacterium]|nr:hypothetical protein [Clostridia bacterium]
SQGSLQGFSHEYNDIGGNSEKDYFDDDENNSGGNISEMFKSRNNKVTAQGSALRLILVLILAILLTLAIWFVYKNRRKKNQSKK